MSDMHQSGEYGGAEFNEAARIAEQQEMQRLFALVSQPNTAWAANRAYSVSPEQVRQLLNNPQAAVEEWQVYIKEEAGDDAEKVKSLEDFWLSPKSPDELGQIIQSWIEEAKEKKSSEQFITALTELKERMVKEAQEFEIKEKRKAGVSSSSRLYQNFAPEFLENHRRVQERYASLQDYLHACLEDIIAGRETLPRGCTTPEDCLKPYWETEYVETKSNHKVYMGSLFALEHGLSFYENPESKLLSHVSEGLGKKKAHALTETESVSLRQRHRDLEAFLEGLAEKMEEGQLGLPEGADNVDNAFKPLKPQEIEQWFEERGLQNHPYKKWFLYDMEKEPDTAMPDAEAEVGGQFDRWERRWQEQEQAKAVKTSYQAPANPTGVEIPSGMIAEFYKRGNGSRGDLEVAEAFGERISGMVFHWGQIDKGAGYLQVSYNSKVENSKTGRMETRKVGLVFNLPPEALQAKTQADRQVIEKAVKECVSKNSGSPFVQAAYDRNTGNMMYGLGSRDHPETGIQLTMEDMRRIAGTKAEEVRDYVDRRARDFKNLDMDTEAQPMWEFERYLLDQYVPGYDAKLRQIVWDEAFKQVWKAKVGQEKFDELARQAAAVPMQEKPKAATGTDAAPATAGSRSAEAVSRETGTVERRPYQDKTDRWAFDSRNWQNPEFLKKVQIFENLMKQNCHGWSEALRMAKRLKESTQDAGLRVPEAFNVLGERILHQPEREAEYTEFRRLLNLNREQLRDFIGRSNWQDLTEENTENKPRILRHILLHYLRENPLPSDTWGKDRLSQANEAYTQPAASRPAARASVERRDPRASSAEVVEEILNYINDLADKHPSGYDPEQEAGII